MSKMHYEGINWGVLTERKVRKALKEMKLPEDTKCVYTPVAGLQFYDADELTDDKNGFLSQVILKREPKNPYDENAIEVYVANGSIMVGHIDRDLACDIAHIIDKFGQINACVLEPYDGEPWSLKLMLYGKDLPDPICINPKH